MKHLAILTLHFSLLTLHSSASVPQRWTVDTSRAQPATFEAYQGETLTFEAALQSAGKPLELSGIAALYWQTNGMGSAFWETTAAVNSNRLSAVWTPEMDVGARVYNCFIGIPGKVYRAAFQLRLRPSPGAEPNTLPLPVPVIDFAKIRVLNPPWGSGGGGVDTNAVRNIILDEITPATNSLNQTLSYALDDKRDEDDLNVYYRAFTGRENWTLKRDSQEYELEYVSEGYWKHDYTEPGFYDYIRIRNGTNFEYGENVGTGEHAIWYDDYNQFQEHPEYIDMSGIRTYVSRTPQGSIKPTSDRLATTNGVNEAIASATNDSSIVRAPLNEYGQRVFSEPLFVPPGTDDFNINATTHFYDPVSIYNISFLRDSNGNDVLNTLANKADRATTLLGYGITDAAHISMISASDPAFSNAVSTVAKTVTTPPSPTLRLFDEVRQCYWIGRMVNGVINWEVE